VFARAFDAIGDPLFLFDANGRTVVANRAAEHWLTRTADVTVEHGRWAMRDRRADDRFNALLVFMRNSPVGIRSQAFDCTLDGMAASVHLTPLVEDSGVPLVGQHCGAMIRIAFPCAQTEAAVSRLAASHGFTTAESAVCLGILLGRGPKLIAADRCVSLTTVRSQLKALYAKCGCHNQMELAAMARRHFDPEPG
jgi:DNA-binding CsgD family transcriptional regulator